MKVNPLVFRHALDRLRKYRFPLALGGFLMVCMSAGLAYKYISPATLDELEHWVIGLAVVAGFCMAMKLSVEMGRKAPKQYAVSQMNEVISQYSSQGYLLVHRSETQVQIVRKKEFGFYWACLWFLVFGIGLLFYIFYYMAQSDEVVLLNFSKD